MLMIPLHHIHVKITINENLIYKNTIYSALYMSSFKV